MFLNEINVNLVEVCFADLKKIRLKADLSDDITEVMPYLNTVIASAYFNRDTSLLTFTKESRIIVARARDLTVAKATDIEDARRVLGWLKDLINETWLNRDKITPNYEMKQRPTATQVFMLFPKTNCGECGEANCYAFVVKILHGSQQLNNCKPLLLPKYGEARDIVSELLG